MTVGELRRTMSSAEFVQWIAYYRLNDPEYIKHRSMEKRLKEEFQKRFRVKTK